MPRKDRSAVVYIAAAVPALLIKLVVSYLRMKRRAVKAERRFYRTLLENGMDKRSALELSSEYSGPVTISYWIKGFRPGAFSAAAGKKKDRE
ncbi:MAG: hypothetical protein WC375_07580 [Methanomassiliicoccales archaeon]|jgi:hypothetical protein